uniref:Uncharacterized protein n=1 Tax=Streptomyces sp. NBC_00049 TaxID=2903617 RepID=A0AAU2JV09_9ACTN
MRSTDGTRRTTGPIRRALVALLVAGVTVACGPAEGGGTAASLPPVPALTSATPSPTPTPSPSATLSATPSAVPSPAATSAAPTTPAAPAARPADPKPAATTQPPKPATQPAPRPSTKAPTRPAAAECEIVSNAGNCYNAGQFCRKADLGRTTHAGNGRLIHCRLDGSQPRWQY